MGFNDEITNGIVKAGRTRKYLFGYAGRTSQMLPLFDWIMLNEKHKEWRSPEDCYKFRESLQTLGEDLGRAMLVDTNGQIYEVTTEGYCITIPRFVHAMGNGSEYALGAMEAGADADHAIRIAGKFDAFTNQTIHTFGHDDPEMIVRPYTIRS
jgi:ATP-dependent protease HslVU (ClpYQ) peptidase subunit